jgi:hypothetical protein
MSTLELNVGDLKPRAVEFTATELVVTLVDGRKIVTPLAWYPRLLARRRRSVQNMNSWRWAFTGLCSTKI